MKAAFGGAFLIKLMLIFLTLYIAFMAVALNYARGFRVKNQIINIVEQNEGFTIGGTADDKIKDLFSSIGYFSVGSCSTRNLSGSNNYCIYESEIEGRGKTYSITTFVKINLPFQILGVDGITIPIKGETKLIQTF